MPAKPRAKADRAAVVLGVYGAHPDPYQYLAMRFVAETDTKAKDRLALELLPYEKPKLKQMDVSQTTDVNVKIAIDGTDERDGGDRSVREGRYLAHG